MIVGIEQCPDCDQPVIRGIFRGRDMLVEVTPHPDGDLELAGLRTLRKPIVIHHPLEKAGDRYRPHLAVCPVEQARRSKVSA